MIRGDSPSLNHAAIATSAPQNCAKVSLYGDSDGLGMTVLRKTSTV